MTKYQIEMVLPDDIDSSEILARLQELAVEMHEECEDEDPNEPYMSREDIEDEVTILPLLGTPKAS